MFKSKLLPALLAAAVTSVLVACTADDARVSPQAGHPSGSSSRTVAPQSDRKDVRESIVGDLSTEELRGCRNKQGLINGEPASLFGADAVLRAYCEIGHFNLDVAFSSELLRPVDHHPDDFEIVHPYLTRQGREALEKTLPNALAGKRKAFIDVYALVYFGYTPEPGKEAFRAVGPVVRNPNFGRASFGVDRTQPQPRLALSLDVTGDLLLSQDGVDKVTRTRKSATYWLVPNPGNTPSWLIDGWESKFHVGKVRRDK